MNWCRKHGIEPVTSERRSLQWWKRRVRTIAAAFVFAVLLPVIGEAGILCKNLITGDCQNWILGNVCPTGYNEVDFCPAVTPTPIPVVVTPTPTRTPTPAVTPPPYTYTVTEFLKSRDLGYSYIMAMTMLDGVVFLTGGVCCPAIGSGIGECQAAIDYTVTPPVHREFVCTSRDSSEMWEVVAAQVAHSDVYRWVVAGEHTRRPATGALQASGTASYMWGFGIQSITDPFFSWKSNVGRLLYPEFVKRWPLAILDLDGLRYLYTMILGFEPYTGKFALQRFAWPGAYHPALYTTTTNLGELAEPLSPIAIDADGSLIATLDVEPTALMKRLIPKPAGVTAGIMWYPSSAATKIRVVRSRDQGRTWSETGIVINAPAGRTLWGCGWDHRSGGAAKIPWHLLCVISTGKGPEVGDWNGASVRFNGATAPPNFGQKPVLWKAVTP